MAKSKNLFLSLLMAAFISGAAFLSTSTGCASSDLELKGKLCLQDVLCENKDKVFVHTIINIIEGGRAIFGYNSLPCGEINFTAEQIQNFKIGDIITLSSKKIGNGELCPVKVENWGTEPRDYPTGEVIINSDQVQLE